METGEESFKTSAWLGFVANFGLEGEKAIPKGDDVIKAGAAADEESECNIWEVEPSWPVAFKFG